jgi:hypothetical protein
LKQAEPTAKQPFKGIVIEVVRTWHNRSGEAVADHRYQARRGKDIIANDSTYDRICTTITEMLRRQNQPVVTVRPRTWLERLTDKWL